MNKLKKIYYPILAILLVALMALSFFSVTLNFSTPYISTSLTKTNAIKIAQAGNYDITDDNSSSDYASDRYQITSAINTALKNSITKKYKNLYDTNGEVKTLTTAPSSSISDILMGQYVELDMNDNEIKKYELAPAYYSMRKTIDATDVSAIPNAQENGLIQGMIFQNIVLYIPGSQSKTAFTKTNNSNAFVYDEESLADVAVLVAHYDSQVGDNGYVNNSLTVGAMLALVDEIINGEKTYSNDFLIVFTDGANHNGLGLDYFLNTDRYDNFFGNATDRIKSIAIFDAVGDVSTVTVTQAKGGDAISIFASTPLFSQAGSFSGDIASAVIDRKEFNTINGISAIEILGVGNKYDITTEESLTDERIEKVTSVLGAYAEKVGNVKLGTFDSNATVGYFTFVGIKFWFASYVAYILGALIIALAGVIAWYVIKKNALDVKKVAVGSAVSALSVVATIATLAVLYCLTYLLLAGLGVVSVYAIATFMTDNIIYFLLAFVLGFILLTIYNKIFKNAFDAKSLSVAKGNAWVVMLIAAVLCFVFPTYSYLFAPLALLQGAFMLVSILCKDKFKAKYGFDIERLLGYGAAAILLLPIVFAESVVAYFASSTIFLPLILGIVLVYFQSIVPYLLIIKDLLGIKSKKDNSANNESVVNKTTKSISKNTVIVGSLITLAFYTAAVVVGLLTSNLTGLASAQTKFDSANSIYNNAFIYEYINDNGTESKSIVLKDLDIYSYMRNDLGDFAWDYEKQAFVLSDNTQTTSLPTGDVAFIPFYQKDNSKLIKFGKNGNGDEIRFNNKAAMTITIKTKNASDTISKVRLVPDSTSIETTEDVDAKKYLEYQVNGNEITLSIPAGVGKDVAVEVFAVSADAFVPGVELEVSVKSSYVSGTLDKKGDLVSVGLSNQVISSLSTKYSDSDIIDNIYFVFDYTYVGSLSVPTTQE